MVVMPISSCDIPTVNYDGRTMLEYCSGDSFWRKDRIDPKMEVFYHVFIKDDGEKFYITSNKQNLTEEDARTIYHADATFYQSFELLDELFEVTIECGSYIDECMRAGWHYFARQQKVVDNQ